MVIPHFWAESRLQSKTPAKQVTVKRWGWSDISQEDAQSVADRRAQEAMERILSGEDIRRRELKDAYGAEDGVPIREEVISRHENAIVTRNSYGSLCLNTPNVFFADVDAPWRGAWRIHPAGCLSVVIAGIVVGIWQRSPLLGCAIAIGIPWLWSLVNNSVNRMRRPTAEALAKQENLAAIRSFAASHPEWHLRVYETPAGFRLLAMHAAFDPTGEAAKAALNDLNSDKRFATLCALQACFRARVSPKYWRMGYKPKELLPKSKWPFPPEHVQRRERWVAGYQAIVPKFASCRFIERLGSPIVHPDAESVRALHDQLCRADSSLPLA
ncbi:MAG: hypothetical protein ACKVY0_27765 [Prosthecobacter sp.]|uniref:hypothetical protein n=1 Tax=Prosthecobacter sp. TaxID=1965333 RepID=UPI0038FD6E0F